MAICTLDKKLVLILYSVVATSTLIAVLFYSWYLLESTNTQLIQRQWKIAELMAYKVLADQYSRFTYIYSDRLVYSTGEPVHITLMTEFGYETENLTLRIGDYLYSILVAVSNGTPTEGTKPYQAVWRSIIWEVNASTLNGTDMTLLLCGPSDRPSGTVINNYTVTVGQTVLNISPRPSQWLAMSFTWDQTDLQGHQVQPGAYTLFGHLEPGWNTPQFNIFIKQP